MKRPFLVRARALSGFVELAESLGADAGALLARARIDPALLAVPDATLQLDRVAGLLADAATTLATPDFGLRLSKYQDISVLGSMALIARHADCVGTALRGVSRNFAYHVSAVRLELIESATSDRAHLVYATDLAPDVPVRQLMELSIAVAHAFLRLVTGDSGEDWQIGFRHRVGLTQTRYRTFFGCPVGLGADADELVFPKRLLKVAIDPGTAELRVAAERFVGNLIRRFPLDIGQQVEALIERQLAFGGCGIERIAAQLGMHKRTLQRRLAEHRLVFEDLIDRQRRTRAAQLLPHAAIPLSEVCELLGYTEQSSLNRACRRWYGDTPQTTRARMQRGLPKAVRTRTDRTG